MPANVTTGMSAFLSACTQTTRCSATPLRRASFTYSESRTSSIPERSSRIIPATTNQPRVQQLDHRPSRADRVAEVADDGTAHEGQILVDVGPIETQILPRVGVVLLAGVHGQDHVQGIAGGAREDEDDDRQKRQGDERLKKTKHDESNHRLGECRGEPGAYCTSGGGPGPPPPPPPHP